MVLTREQEALLPTDDDVAFYRQHGWYRSKRVLSDALLDYAAIGIQRHFSGERDWILPHTSGFSDWKPGDASGIRNAEVVALQNAEVRTLALSQILGAIAARLTGSPTIRYFSDSTWISLARCLITNPSSVDTPTCPIGGPAPLTTCSQRGFPSRTAQLIWGR